MILYTPEELTGMTISQLKIALIQEDDFCDAFGLDKDEWHGAFRAEFERRTLEEAASQAQATNRRRI